MAGTSVIFPKICQCNYPKLTKEKYCPMQNWSVINKNKQKIENILSYPILCPLCHLHQRKHIKMTFMRLMIYFNAVCQVHIVAKKGFDKTGTFDCSSPQYRGEIVCQIIHFFNKKSYQGIETEMS